MTYTEDVQEEHTMITYVDSAEGISPAQLEGGFFAGWPSPPSPTAHLNILLNSDAIVLALHEGRVVGFITAITDRVSCAYIPHLARLPIKDKGLARTWCVRCWRSFSICI